MLLCKKYFFIVKNIEFVKTRGQKSLKLGVNLHIFSLKFIILGAKLLRFHIFCLCQNQEKKLNFITMKKAKISFLEILAKCWPILR